MTRARLRHAIAALAVAAALASSGCGGGSSEQARAPSPGSVYDTVSQGGDVGASATTVSAESEEMSRGSVAMEPQSVSPGQGGSSDSESDYTRPTGPTYADYPDPSAPVRLAWLHLAPDEELHPPTSACQDVLIFVREGTLSASGTGVADASTPVTLYPGDAVRFGPEGDGSIRNVGASAARTAIVYTRREGSGAAVTSSAALSSAVRQADATRCPLEPQDVDPRIRHSRVAHVATTPALAAAGGTMRVRILLDRDGQGARHGGLAWLDADADARVPEHRHADATELLLVEEGDGLMRLGDREIRVRPGVTIVVPRGVLHDFRGAGTQRLRALQVYTPSGNEQRFRVRVPLDARPPG